MSVFDDYTKVVYDAERKLKESIIEWHPYPQEKPSESGEYLTYIRVPYGGDMYDICEWDCEGVFVKGWDYQRDVIVYAWAKLPEPYKEVSDGR